MVSFFFGCFIDNLVIIVHLVYLIKLHSIIWTRTCHMQWWPSPASTMSWRQQLLVLQLFSPWEWHTTCSSLPYKIMIYHSVVEQIFFMKWSSSQHPLAYFENWGDVNGHKNSEYLLRPRRLLTFCQQTQLSQPQSNCATYYSYHVDKN